MTPLRCLFVLVCLALAACSRPVPPLPVQAQRATPWSRDLVAAMASLPVQHDGRAKPFATLAAFTLYHLHGRRDLKYSVPGDGGAPTKVTLEPTEWLLDVWCYPEQAVHYPLFRVENTGVLDALGLQNDGQKLDFEYLSYAQLLPKGERLQELARSYRQIPAQKRSAVEEHTVQLFQKLVACNTLFVQLQPLSEQVAVQGEALRAVFEGQAQVRLAAVLKRADAFRQLVRSAGDDLENEKLGNVMQVASFLTQVIQGDRGGPLLFPPLRPREQQDTWHSLGEVVDGAMRGGEAAAHVAMVGHLQDAVLAEGRGDKEAALRRFRDAVVAAATARGDYAKIELETDYYRQSWHYQSIHWFLLGFVLAAVGWLLPKSRPVWWASFAVTALALGLLGWDVVLRCLITERPPIKNLYDTFLFIAWVGAAVTLAAEWILPRRIALAVAPFLGALLVMCARLFEVTKGEDTMAPLVAVLDSNFWLATHVTIINIGYAAGLVAAVLANAWILVRVLRIGHPEEPLAKSLVRMAYGVTCFSLAFSVVGTILGGIWANDSWGRFWGWDPKENGALMICLSQIALLHARFSGWVRDFGFMAWSCVTGAVVLFSWFHVNLLGVGLHSYGFASGLHDAVWSGYVVEGGLMLVGWLDVRLRPNPAVRAAASALPAQA